MDTDRMTTDPDPLDQIGQQFNTDKASVFHSPEGEPRAGNDYYRHYVRAFDGSRHTPVLLLQLGNGLDLNSITSLRVWDQYFSHRATRIVGAGYDASLQSPVGSRLQLEPGDTGSDTFLRLLARSFAGMDIVIDDASHQWLHQITAFRALFPPLKPGGLYVIEAVGTSFGEQVRSLYGGQGGDDTFTVMLAYATRLVGNGFIHPIDDTISPDIVDEDLFAMIESITMARGAILIRKAATP